VVAILNKIRRLFALVPSEPSWRENLRVGDGPARRIAPKLFGSHGQRPWFLLGITSVCLVAAEYSWIPGFAGLARNDGRVWTAGGKKVVREDVLA
jgi:hypothetical protein